jgi:hypothetical protein
LKSKNNFRGRRGNNKLDVVRPIADIDFFDICDIISTTNKERGYINVLDLFDIRFNIR